MELITLTILALLWVRLRMDDSPDDAGIIEAVPVLDHADSLILMRYLMSEGVLDRDVLHCLGVRECTLKGFYRTERGKYPKTERHNTQMLMKLAKLRQDKIKAEIEAEALKRMSADNEWRESRQSVQDYYFKKAI